MERTNSERLLFTANQLTTKLSDNDREAAAPQPEGALRKLAFVRALRAVGQVETAPYLDAAAGLARVPAQRLVGITDQVAAVRGVQRTSAFDMVREAFANQIKVSPIGRLHLERLEMYPAGVERGELVFTVPMAPGETVTVSHMEWSTSSQTYENIVQDPFESYSGRGVAEKTDASMSTENEAKQPDSLSFGATLTGSYGPVSLTTTLAINNSNETRDALSQHFDPPDQGSDRERLRPGTPGAQGLRQAWAIYSSKVPCSRPRPCLFPGVSDPVAHVQSLPLCARQQSLPAATPQREKP